MRLVQLSLFLVSLASLLHVDAELTSNSGGKLLITLPTDLREWQHQSHPDGVEAAPADFGLQNWDEELEGIVKILDYDAKTLCSPITKTRKELWPEVNEEQNVILLLERGDCYFALKAEHAQGILRADGSVGIDAIIIADNKQEGLITMAVPEQWRHGKVTIPVVEVPKDVGDKIENTLCDGPYTADCTGTEEIVVVTLGWDLPRNDEKVEWEMWTSSSDSKAVGLKKSMALVDEELSDKEIIFKPHYIIWPGELWKCDQLWPFCTAGQDPTKDKCAAPGQDYARLPCMRRCSNYGRYCAEDPENDMLRGIEGVDIVQENLRQMCVWKFADQTTSGETDAKKTKMHSIWWTYANLFQANCAPSKAKWNQECWEAQMRAAGAISGTCSLAGKPSCGPPEEPSRCKTSQEACTDAKGTWTTYSERLVNSVNKCIKDSGGYDVMDDTANTMLDAEIASREEWGVGVTSTLFVNGRQFHGHWACPKPINRDTCGLVKMICASYKEGENCSGKCVRSEEFTDYSMKTQEACETDEGTWTTRCQPSQCTAVDKDCHFACAKTCAKQWQDGILWPEETPVGAVVERPCPCIEGCTADNATACPCTLAKKCEIKRGLAVWGHREVHAEGMQGANLKAYADKLTLCAADLIEGWEEEKDAAGAVTGYVNKQTGEKRALDNPPTNTDIKTSAAETCSKMKREDGKSCEWTVDNTQTPPTESCECNPEATGVWVVLLVIGVILLIVLSIGLVFLYKRSQRHESDFKKLIDQYQLMDEDGNKLTVPDDEPEPPRDREAQIA